MSKRNELNKVALLILLVSQLNVSGQYVKFPIDSAIWRVDYWNFTVCGIPQPNAQYQYTFEGDSIVSAWISPDGVGHYAFIEFRTK